MKKILMALVVGSLLLIGTTGCVEEETPSGSKSNNSSSKTETKKEFEQNEIVKYKDVEYSITGVQRSSGSEWDNPASGKEFIIVSIKIENKSQKKISYNVYDWKMQNSAGQEDSQSFTSINTDTSLSSGDLVAGGVKEGSIAFEQPVGDQALKLNYYGSMLSDNYAFQIKLSN